MARSHTEVLQQLLADLSLASVPDDGAAWPVYVGREPDKPDNCLTLYATEGIDHGRIMKTGETTGPEGFQVRVRATDYRTGRAKADAIKLAFERTVYDTAVSLDSETYFVLAVTRIGDVLELGRDSPTSQRQVFTLNALVYVRNP